MKQCGACGLLLDLARFSEQSDSKDGLASQCKACLSDKHRIYYLLNPEKAKEQSEKKRKYAKRVGRVLGPTAVQKLCERCGTFFKVEASRADSARFCSQECRANDLAGLSFGRLNVISRADKESGRTAWNCVCSCGTKVAAETSRLLSGQKKSCGCLARESAKDTALRMWTAEAKKRAVATRRAKARSRTTKLCRTCMRTLPRHDFYIRDGLLYGPCKRCQYATSAKWAKANRERVREACRNCMKRKYARDPEHFRAKARVAYANGAPKARASVARKELQDAYVKQVLYQGGLRWSEIPQELIEAKRMQLKVMRIIKEKRK